MAFNSDINTRVSSDISLSHSLSRSHTFSFSFFLSFLFVLSHTHTQTHIIIIVSATMEALVQIRYESLKEEVNRLALKRLEQELAEPEHQLSQHQSIKAVPVEPPSSPSVPVTTSSSSSSSAEKGAVFKKRVKKEGPGSVCYFTNCEMCNKTVPANSYAHHLKTCRARPGITGQTKKRKKREAVKVKVKQGRTSRLPRSITHKTGKPPHQCPYCDRKLQVNGWTAHMTRTHSGLPYISYYSTDEEKEEKMNEVSEQEKETQTQSEHENESGNEGENEKESESENESESGNEEVKSITSSSSSSSPPPAAAQKAAAVALAAAIAAEQRQREQREQQQQQQ